MDTKDTSIAGSLRIRVQAFARIRELLGRDAVELELPPGATVGDVQRKLTAQYPELAAIAAATRLARNGRVARATDALADGDEIALLPPVGGG